MGEGVGDVCVALPNDGEMNIEKSFRIESKRDHLWVADSTDTEPCAKKQAIEVCNDSEIETRVEKQDREVSNDTEMEPCANYQSKETLNATEMELSYNMEVKEAPIDIELEHSAKNQGKETSNDDILSEVSNPNLSPRENASSFQTISSRLVQLERNKHGGCGEITYDNSVNSSSEDTLSEEEQSRNTTTSEVSKSHVVLEIPKHASTTGIRKITFKFSKRKEDYVKQTPVDELPPAGFHEIPASHPSFDGVNAESSGKGFTESSDSLLCPSNTEPKMSKKVVPGYPTNVKKLLSTRILEGARVKYISASAQRELPGIIKGCGYVCGCSVCNFSKVLSAYEFELHAGGKTRHPNNHIYLENGKPIYNIINELKNAPLSALEEVIRNVAGSSVNDESLKIWKANMQLNEGLDTGEKNGVVNCPGMPHSAIGCSGQRVEDGFGLASCSCVPNVTFKTAEERKQMMKKSRSNSSSSIGAKKRVAEGGTKKRDNDLHRVLFLPNGLPDGTELAYYSKGKRILGGYKQGNGIVCSCCDTEISPSQFESHAGWAAKRQPYRHIYTSNGLTLHDIALLLANGQNLSISNSDDMCAICGDGGQLSFCDGCPRAFHAACLGVECVPTGGWHCSYCGDKSGPSRRAVGESRPIIIRLTRVVKAPEAEVGGCVVCRAQDFSVAKFDERTVILCDQCEKEYHVGCLRETGLCDLKELPKDKWFCCDDCNMIHTTLQNSVLNGADTIPASVSTSLVKKLAEKGSIDGSMNDIQWRIISGKNRRPEHKPLLTRATAIFRECFDPIVAKSGRDLIPVMVYGRNISGQEFGGIYCVVLIVKQVVVSAGLLRIFGREVAELPIVATSRENQGKGYFQALFSCIERLLFSMNVQRIVLPAAEDAESIWTNKLGFRKMSEEQLKKTRDFQLTVFKGTSMLEKEVCQVPDS